jgi:hypothetical protein
MNCGRVKAIGNPYERLCGFASFLHPCILEPRSAYSAPREVVILERRYYSEKCTYVRGEPEVFCGFCYENRKGRAAHRGHRYFVSRHIPQVRYEELNMQRPSQAARPKKGEFICPDSDFLQHYPKLAAGLCDPWWDDGKPREPWTMKISMNPEGVVLTINDKDSKLVAFTTARGLQDGLASIEEALSGGGLSWRKSKY